MDSLPTPVSLLEDYFGKELTTKDISSWDTISDESWIDFAKTYLAQMKVGFTAKAMADRIEGQKLRLYFDKNFGADYDRAIEGRFAKTPLLGLSPYPAEKMDYRGGGLVQAIAPIAKHLLVSDEVYLSDNFYRSIDTIADTWDRNSWREDQWGFQMRLAGIRQWLRILAGLRDLITSGVINFFPYYVIPSFQTMVDAAEGRHTDAMDELMKTLDVPGIPGLKDPGEPVEIDFANFLKPPKIPPTASQPRLDTAAITKAWVDARLLGVDPVFANKDSWRWASGIEFHNETKMQATSDLMSIDIIPLGGDNDLSLKDITSMRKNEEVFTHVRDTLLGCKEYLRENVSETATDEYIKKTCRTYVRDTLDPPEKFKNIKFLDNDLVGASALTVGFGALFLSANPFIALAAGALLTPKVFLKVAGAADKKLRAAVRIEALL